MADLFYYLFVNPFTGNNPHIYPFLSICIILDIAFATYFVIDVVRSELRSEIHIENGYRYIHVEDGVFTRAVWGFSLAMFMQASGLFFGGLIYAFLAPTTQSLESIVLADYLKQLLTVIGVDFLLWVVIFVVCAIFAPMIEAIRLRIDAKAAK